MATKTKTWYGERFDNGSTLRFDLEIKGHPIYGVGRISDYQANRFFLNCYRLAPLDLRLVNGFGIFKKKYNHGQRQVWYSGSISDPYHTWHLRFGRFWIEGTTYQILVKFLKYRAQKKWEKESEAMEKYLRTLPGYDYFLTIQEQEPACDAPSL